LAWQAASRVIVIAVSAFKKSLFQTEKLRKKIKHKFTLYNVEMGETQPKAKNWENVKPNVRKGIQGK
jgi:thioredoxin-related protein